MTAATANFEQRRDGLAAAVSVRASDMAIAPAIRGGVGPDDPTVAALVGLRGSGKSTAAAKLITRLRLVSGFRVGVLAEDRSGRGVEPLAEFADLLGAPFLAIRSPRAAASAMERMRSRDIDVVIFDAEGVEPDDPSATRDSARWLEAVGATETHLAIRCDHSRGWLEDAARVFAPLGADRALLTYGDRVGLDVAAGRLPEPVAAWLALGRWRLAYASSGPDPPTGFDSLGFNDKSK